MRMLISFFGIEVVNSVRIFSDFSCGKLEPGIGERTAAQLYSGQMWMTKARAGTTVSLTAMIRSTMTSTITRRFASARLQRPVFEIIPFVGGGPLRFNDKRSEVRAAMTAAGYPLMNARYNQNKSRDIFGNELSVLVNYDSRGGSIPDPLIEIAQFQYPALVRIQLESLVHVDPLLMPYRDFIKALKTIDPELRVDWSGCTSAKYGILTSDSSGRADEDENADYSDDDYDLINDHEPDDYGVMQKTDGPLRSFRSVGFIPTHQLTNIFRM